MANSPLSSSGETVRIVVRCNGIPQPELPLASLTVRQAINGESWARLVLLDGDPATGSWPLSDGDLFQPGATVGIGAGYGDGEDAIFSGVVVRHGVTTEGRQGSRLVVECRGEASLGRAQEAPAGAAAALALAYGTDLVAFEAEIDAQAHPAPNEALTEAPQAHGRMRFRGSALARPGSLIDVSGVGARFSGSVFVRSVEHEIVQGNWLTTVAFGRVSVPHDAPAGTTSHGPKIEFDEAGRAVTAATPPC